MTASVYYTITPIPHRHVFKVNLRVSPPHALVNASLELNLPNWIAGSYMIRDFARHIVTIKAFDSNHQAVTLTPINQHSWRAENVSGELQIEYEVFAHDTSVRTAFLDTDGGFFNATSLCLCIPALAMTPHVVQLNDPSPASNWQVATTLPRTDGSYAHDFGEFMAANYDELADHPVRFGNLTWLTFGVFGVLHEVAFAGELPFFDAARLKADLELICAEQMKLFEPNQPSHAPFERFLFLVDVRGSGYGGLEHRSSTALLCERADLPNLTDCDKPRSDAYINFLGLCSHEYFHSWNVKRIKPAAFVNYDFSNIIDTSLLWFFEGVTSYYDDLMLYRSGILDEAGYLKKLLNAYNGVVRHDGARVQTVAQSGHYAWTKYYQVSPNTPNAVVSYYSKGALIALAMDLFIRHNSAQVHTLDDVMRDLWQNFGRDFYGLYPQGAAKGVTEGIIVQTVSRFAGVDAQAFFAQALHSTDALPLLELLAAQELILSEPKNSVAQLGATSKKVDGGWQIQRVLNDSAAQKAGLAPDDVLLTFNRLRLSAAPDDVLAKIPLETALCVHFLRDDVLKETTLINAPAPHGVYALDLADNTTLVFNKS